MKIKNTIASLVILLFIGVSAAVFYFFIVSASLPRLITLEDYKPLVVSEIFASDGQKFGEFFREKRIIIPYSKIPKQLVQAFISAEDSKFFEHGGINFVAIMRATIANIKAGHSVQGGSTITQQVAKSLMLTPEKKLSRKVKEAILAYRMEKNLKKEDILYLYLNQIYLGHGAYGVEAAAQNYYRKHVEELTLAECAILAGLPQAPGKYSPVLSPQKAKERQIYVLGRMAEEGYIKKDQARAAQAEPIKVYFKEAFEDFAPYYKETIRQILVAQLGEEKVLDEGIKIYTGLDYKKQLAAQVSIDKNLRELDKRQGYRGALKNLKTAEEIASYLVKERDDLALKSLPYRVIEPDAKDHVKRPLDLTHKNTLSKTAAKNEVAPNLPEYLSIGQIVEAVVTKIESKAGLVTLRFGETQGMLDIDDMSWARKPDPQKLPYEDVIKDPAKILKIGDLISVKIKSDKFASKRLNEAFNKAKAKLKPGVKTAVASAIDPATLNEYVGLALEQDPIAQAAILSFDLETGDVLSMVGGTNFEKSEYNRALQAARQTGSAFKAIVYAAALEKGFTPASVITDAPIVYEEGEGQETKKWKPGNFENKFSGDVLFRTSIIKSLNIPTVKILENIGIDWVSKYARHLGIFSPLNSDFTMALGSSSITLYEMTKAFSVFPRGGKRLRPILIRKVTDASGKTTLSEKISLDEKFKKELDAIDQAEQEIKSAAPKAPTQAAKPNATPTVDFNTVFNFTDPEQLISPQTAYITTHLLKGVVLEGTGARAQSLGRPTAGKTGTTNGYSDAWYVGFTPKIATGVWVGYDEEKPLGRFETGNAAALPIWIDYMKVAIADTPASDFEVPPGIVFSSIDAETGKIGSAKSKRVVREAFREGTEPTETNETAAPSEEKNFFKEDLSN
jgi:penicillin-binding protein 1A